MICEFLPVEYKKRLLEIATIDDLIAVGYTKKSAYQAKEKGIISDEKCEKLVYILGKKAFLILEEALYEFTDNIYQLEKS
ncbi:hypothetical protein [Saccharolobus islandicus]|uniref:Uncharacterized protein n=1 Tax=Saccharolobus islandicus (strain M.16.4 / Kamchatka \|nr:hypothetical protein [Sulfolobus islandicus]ACR40774.1 hypothetical protein M164_0140 [Sulfolobus islandicus M.16.4]